MAPSAAFATAITNADISITSPSITTNDSYTLAFLPDSSPTFAQAGPDNLNNQNTVLSFTSTPADASIGNATGHADFSGSTADNNALNPANTTVSNGPVNASSSVNLGGANDSSQGSGKGCCVL
ncbi:MAG: hypothetical protein WAN51_13140 [Alphaproteobacteria bacterium]